MGGMNVRMEITVEGELDLERFAGALARLLGGNGQGNGHGPLRWQAVETQAAAALGLPGRPLENRGGAGSGA